MTGFSTSARLSIFGFAIILVTQIIFLQQKDCYNKFSILHLCSLISPDITTSPLPPLATTPWPKCCQWVESSKVDMVYIISTRVVQGAASLLAGLLLIPWIGSRSARTVLSRHSQDCPLLAQLGLSPPGKARSMYNFLYESRTNGHFETSTPYNQHNKQFLGLKFWLEITSFT